MATKTQVQLNDVLKHDAGKAIMTMVREANKTGGYNAILKKLQEKEEGLSKHIYALALKASNMGRGKNEVIAEWFAALCKAAEQHLKDNSMKELGHEIENVKEALPCWPVFKSEIGRAIKAGLDPKNYETLNKLKAARKAVDEQRAQRGANPEGNANRQDGQESEGGQATGTAPQDGKIKVTATLSATLAIMQKRIQGMTDEQQDMFANRLALVLNEMDELTQQSTDDQPQEVASGEAEEAGEEGERQAG
jgi:hypothetical protein